MQYADYDRAAVYAASQRAEVLIEALPWIKDMTGQTVVIKYGGAAMTDANLRSMVIQDIVLMKLIGLNPIVVHGGGKDITELCEKLSIPVEFKDGMRVTTPETMDVVSMALLGRVNAELVAGMNLHGHIAVGLSGASAGLMKAKCLDESLGRVGLITDIDTTLIQDLVAGDYIPVIATVAYGEEGEAYNINADVAAGQIAAAIGARKVIFLTDVDGLYQDFSDKTTLISRLSLDEARDLVESGILAKGMIPKINACVTALNAGVTTAHILNGTSAHSMLLEVFTDRGIGTMIYRDEPEPDFVEFPLTNLAAKISAAQEEGSQK